MRTRVYVLAFVVVTVAELIGSFNIPAGPGKIILLPLLWALLLGGAIGVARNYMPGPLKVDTPSQFYASAVLQSARRCPGSCNPGGR
jgi:hypothetical protein